MVHRLPCTDLRLTSQRQGYGGLERDARRVAWTVDSGKARTRDARWGDRKLWVGPSAVPLRHSFAEVAPAAVQIPGAARVPLALGIVCATAFARAG
jgi:hypothetical protein